jgi:F-type H+-transporting ATPase subunit b
LELNWSTFVLEIINFLILVWILKRFFYQPVLDVIARRRAGIEKTRADAKTLQDEAQTLHRQYENRLTDWDKERRAAREQLAKEIEAERTQRLQTLSSELAQERERSAVVEQRRLDGRRRQLEQTALAQGAQFAARLLSLAAGPPLQEKLLELLLQQLDALPAARREELRNGAGTAIGEILVTSAYPLDTAMRQRLEQTLGACLEAQLPSRYQENPELLAGVRITFGAWVLHANLQDELAGFARLAHDSPGE